MKSLILYASQSGNTEKVALAIKKELQCEAVNIKNLGKSNPKDFWTANPADIYFIGTGIYAGKVHSALHDFFIAQPPLNHGQFSLFATWVGRGNSGVDSLDKFAKYLQKHNSKIVKPYFLCYGKVALFRFQHPDDADLRNACTWAQSIVGQNI